MFIAKGKEFNTIQSHVNAPLFKCIFDYDFNGKCEIKITVVGLYRLFLNGKELNNGKFSPYLSNPDEVVFYDVYDITGKLKEKGNVLCVLLGNGFINNNDFDIWQNETAPYRSAPKFSLELTVDGKSIIESDESFLVADSPITFDDFRCGERYDANLEMPNVLTSTSLDGFNKPITVEPPEGELIKNTTQPIKEYRERKAVSITKTEKGHVYDFGLNDTGIPRLKITAKKGQRIDLYFAETIDDNGVDFRSISFVKSNLEYVQHDVYICKDGKQEYKPSFTWHGFRYAEVRGITDEQATKDTLTFIPTHSAIDKVCDFNCDNETINKLVEITLRSDESNFIYYPYDCPHREKNGWTADASLSAEQMLYMFDAYDSLKQWLLCIRKAQRRDGALPGIIPTAGWGFQFGNGPAWDSVLIELPYQLYRFYGKDEIIKENAEAIEKYFGYIKTRLNADGLIEIGLGDWCQTYTSAEGDYETPVEITDSLTIIDMVEKTAEMFGVIGKNAEDIKQFGNYLKNSFRQKYIKNGQLTVKTQTALSMCLQLNIFNAEEVQTAYETLLSEIKKQNDHFRVGVIGYKYLFDVLVKKGNQDLCFKLITQKSFPSYGYVIDCGATTLWESFDEYERINGKLMRKDGVERIPSFNHHFWGGVLAWIYRYIGWLNVKSEDTIEIVPMIFNDINRAEISYSRNGKSIFVKWEKVSGSIKLTVKNNEFNCAFKNNGQEKILAGDCELFVALEKQCK